ncbi:MAG TPA: hypothetical protein VIY28_10930 [Pseudonocardiaceae bacterium]
MNATNVPSSTAELTTPLELEELTQIDWPRGTVFTRAQLEAARDGRPYAEE